MSRPRVTWTEEMTDTLREMRVAGLPLLLCAEIIGVSYPTVVIKARELNLSQRLNFGRTPGHQVLSRKTS